MTRNLKLAGIALALLLAGVLYFQGSNSSHTDAAPEALEIGDAQVLAGDEAGDLAAAEGVSESGARRDALPAQVAEQEEASAESKAAASRASEGPTLYGVVVDENGQSVPNAEVTITGKLAGNRLIDLGELALSETTQSDNQGRFRIPRGYWPKVEVKVELKARGHLLTESTSTPATVSGDGDLGSFEVQRGVILGGIVTDSEGKPVVGADIWRTSPDEGVAMPQIFAMANKLGRFGGAATESDENGRFELVHELPGAYAIHVDHEDHPRGRFEGTAPSAGTQDLGLRLQLEMGATISGRLIDFPPLRKGVTIRARSLRDDAAGEDSPMMGLFGGGSDKDQQGTPDRHGQFVVKGLNAGEKYTLQAFVRDGIMNKVPCSDEKVANAGSESLELQWDKGAGVRFRIQDSASGKPIVGGEVRYRWTDGEANMMANARKVLEFSGSEGLIGELRPNPSPGTLEIALSSDGYLEERVLGISVEEFELVDIGTISMRKAPSFRVQVLEASSGEPIRRARVVLRPEVEDEEEFFSLGGKHSTGKTDSDGWCVLEACSTPTGSLSVRRKGFAPVDLDGLAMPTAGEQSEVVRLSVGGVIEVTVLEGNREPAFEVNVIHAKPDGSKETRTTPKNGRLVYKDQLPGEHRFRTTRESNRRRRGARFNTRSDDQEEEDWETVVLGGGAEASLTIALAPTTSLKGRVTLRGEPVSHAKISLIPGEDLSEQDEMLADLQERMARMTNRGGTSTTTDSRGEFLLEKQQTGKHQLRVSRGGDLPSHYVSVDLDPTQNHVDVELPSSGVEGRVVDEKGRPIVGAGVRIRRVRETEESDDAWGRQSMQMASSFFGGGAGFGNHTDAEGRYQIEGITPDVTLAVEVQVKGYVDGTSEPFTARDNEQVHAKTVKLTRAGSIRVLVSGTAMMFRPVYATRLSSEGPGAGQAAAMVRDGAARLQGLSPGEWRVSSDKDGEGSTVLVMAGEESEIRLEP